VTAANNNHVNITIAVVLLWVFLNNGVVAGYGGPPPKFWTVGKLAENLRRENFSSKNANIEKSKIKLLSIVIFFVENLHLSVGKLQLSVRLLFNPRRSCA